MTLFTPRRLSLLAAASLTLVLSACGGGGGETKPLELTLLHINDHHSRLDADTTTVRLKNAAGTREAVTMDIGGFARVTAAFEALAAGRPHVLKLHAGDALTGDLYYTLDEGRSDAAMMNTVCFDAMAVGNHEFDQGDAGLRKFIDFLQAGPCKTPVLSANLRPRAGGPLGRQGERVKPSTVVTRDGQRIGLIGLTIAGKTAASSRPDAGTTFEDEATAAQREIDRLKAAGINKIILLTHLTHGGDLQLAARLSDVDVIVGGDSHTLLGPDTLRDAGFSPQGAYPTLATNRNGDRVCVVQAWQYSHAVGELRVRFDGRGTVSACEGQPHLLLGDTPRRGSTPVGGDDLKAMQADLASLPGLRSTPPSASATATLAPFKAAKDDFAKTLAGTAAENLCLRRVPGTKRDATRSSLGDACNLDPRVIAHGGDVQQLVAQAFLEQGEAFGGADLALQNGGGVRVDLAAGDVTVGRIYTLLPFKNTLVRLHMTGAQIKAALEDGLGFLLAGSGNTGAYPYTAGLRFQVDLNQPAGSRVQALQVRDGLGGWTSLDMGKTYRLITNDFLANGGDGYATLKGITGALREDTFLDYADSFLQYTRRTQTLKRLPVEAYSTQGFIDTP